MLNYVQAKTIPEQKGFAFDPMKLNFSNKWLNSFMRANNIINPVRLYGESKDADMVSVAAHRQQLPTIRKDYDYLDRIYTTSTKKVTMQFY